LPLPIPSHPCNPSERQSPSTEPMPRPDHRCMEPLRH
jgi:hypothetical protein